MADAASEMSQEEMLAQQKANCIFCKIIAGEVPGKKVYEDERMVAILDIRPATKGHVLVMTKEHYPIMPVIPPEEFDHLFGRTAALSKALCEGMLAQGCTTFIANGAVAGQQSPHFLFHLIPREKGDGLDMLSPPAGEAAQSDITQMVAQNLAAVMRQHLEKTGKTKLLIPPDKEKEAEEEAKESFLAQSIPEPLSQAPTAQSTATEDDDIIPATGMSIEELFAFIDAKPKLRALMLYDPDKLIELIPGSTRLQKFFAGSDLQVIVAAYRSREARLHEEEEQEADASRETGEQPEEESDSSERSGDEKPSLDDIGRLFP